MICYRIYRVPHGKVLQASLALPMDPQLSSLAGVSRFMQAPSPTQELHRKFTAMEQAEKLQLGVTHPVIDPSNKLIEDMMMS